jgi:hypothetical protein
MPKEPDHSSPKWTFVAKFEDGVFTRMTTFCTDGKFDLDRGLAVARFAYQSKTGYSHPPPLIVAAKYVEPGYDDIILKEYAAEEIPVALAPVSLSIEAPQLGAPEVDSGPSGDAGIEPKDSCDE